MSYSELPLTPPTSFRPGTRFAGQAVRNDSYGLEIYSPYQDKELPENIIYDCGDLEMAVGSPEMALDQIESCVAEIVQDGKIPFYDRGGTSGDAGQPAGSRRKVSGSSYHTF